MRGRRKVHVVGVSLVLAVVAACLWAADKPSSQARREALMRTYQAGNFKDAYDGLRKFTFDPEADPLKVGEDLRTAVTCLQRLGRSDEIDDYREEVIKVHATNWRLVETAAQSYVETEHHGFIVAGKFYRGNKRGGGRYVGTMQRDRVRALQLMQQALEQTRSKTDKPALSQFHLRFANMLLQGGGYYEPWRLQYLTDLTQLPDYEEGYNYYRGQQQGAPVDADGKPVYHKLPNSYEAAASDGERWRWMLSQAVEFDASRLNEVEIIFANFQRTQFGVQTMAYYGRGFQNDGGKDKKSGTFALHTLGEDETIARLASGIHRFKVPEEFNWIKIYQRVAGRGISQYGEQARDTLAQIFEDRRQYVKAAAAWKKSIDEYGVGKNLFRQHRREQIVGNWGRFESGQTQPAGPNASVDFRFRNGNKVHFEATAIHVAKLLDDVKTYLKSNPGRLDWQKINIGNIGYRLVEQQESQYLGEKMAAWDLDLKPRPEHVDERVTVATPLTRPGAYLLAAKMADGNLSRIIVWVSDTAIVKKQLDGRVYYFVADAVTGQPVAAANVDFFGWKQVQVAPQKNEFRVDTVDFSDTADQDGQLFLGQDKMPTNNQWLITAHGPKGGKERLAYLGFSNVWFGQTYDPEYNQTKVFTITDRPVYRPEQTVQFKFWVRHAKYDQDDTSSFANQNFTVQIHNPKGEKIHERGFTADEYGGLSGELPLPKGAMLGVYALNIVNHGGGTFRVEEYKKPEFEVKIEAPKEPVRLGERIQATIQAKYYFGAPVTKARVKYKVLRSSYSANWYPRGDWDWFYGSGYWWFAADYNWYPGWREWGCKRPFPWWYGGRHEQPKVVLENEVDIGPDGVVAVPIDTLPAKELHGDQDQQYTITAEVVDESRRTIVGTGNVLVAKKPFQVYAWVNRGHVRAGDDIHASFRAQTLDQKPVQGKGEVTLFQITYNAKNEPEEKAVQNWKLDTDADGQARQQMKAAEAGQYRLDPQMETSLAMGFYNLLRQGEIGMANLGVFGDQVVEELGRNRNSARMALAQSRRGEAKEEALYERESGAAKKGFAAAGPADSLRKDRAEQQDKAADGKPGGGEPPPPPLGQPPSVRKNFADTAFWAAALTTDKDGLAEVSLNMPENLTGWKVKVWAMGHGTKVGQGEVEVVTKKNLLVRLQAPRFFVQKDEVVLSANVHNYLKTDKKIGVSLELDGGTLTALGTLLQEVRIPAGGEQRVDWRVKVVNEGVAVVRMKAVSDEESDAMEMRFPCYVHGMLKTDSFAGVVRPDQDSARVAFTVPEERRINESRLEVRYSPTLAGAMVDALPYLVEYPYGCTEQTLNRFLPTVITQRILMRMNLDLKEIEKKRTNLNAQEIGDARERAKGWKRFPRNPVFDKDEVQQMVNAGLLALQGMQCADGGWGWFSGYGEHSYPHTTAVVVHGLQIARQNDVPLPPNMLERGIDWLKNYQNTQVLALKNAPGRIQPWKEYSDNIDALVYMVLADADFQSAETREYLYRDRTHLAVYAKAMYGLALHKQQQADKLAMILKNIEQFVVQDDENQTAYLKLPENNWWWHWYGSEIEADAYYLKLLSRTNPKDEKASRLVKYLLNNRKNSTYWTNTRDTAVCIEAIAEYLTASGEDRPDMTVEVWLDGKKLKEVKIDSANLFTFDNQFVLFGDAVESGKHTLEVKRKGTGPVYFNAYVTNFTLEDFITKAGLEVKVNRKYYKLTRADKNVKVEGSRGQAADQRVERYQRTELANLAQLKSGDLVEVELEIDSKNDYEYLIFEDPKAAGFEPMLVRSGYNPNDMGAYMELRDDRVCFFVRQLAHGKHSVSYRLRAEIPGKFSALPTRAYAMYAPELKGNSDEIKLAISD